MPKGSYEVYDGEILIGRFNGREIADKYGIHRYSASKYAYSGEKIHGRYTVVANGQEKDMRAFRKSEKPAQFEERWNAAVSVLKRTDMQAFRLEWERAVKPIRRKSWLWKEK